MDRVSPRKLESGLDEQPSRHSEGAEASVAEPAGAACQYLFGSSSIGGRKAGVQRATGVSNMLIELVLDVVA